MKLKKIASLMLAGIMAVSMLAACGDSAKDNTNPPASSETTTSNLAGTFEDAINNVNDDLKVTVAENTALTNAMTNWKKNNTVVSISRNSIRPVLNSVFGTGNFTNGDDLSIVEAKTVLMDSVDDGSAADDYMFALVTTGAGTSTSDCAESAARAVAANMKTLENVFKGASGNVQVSANYTMYVYEDSYVNAANKTVPYVIAVLKAEYNANI